MAWRDRAGGDRVQSQKHGAGKAPAAKDQQRPGKEPKAEAGSGGVEEESILSPSQGGGQRSGKEGDTVFSRGQRLSGAELDSC